MWLLSRSTTYRTRTPPTVINVAPLAGQVDVDTSVVIQAYFSEALDVTTINATTFELRDSVGSLIPATVSYDAQNMIATLTPNNPLPAATAFTATLLGGGTDPRVKDVAGNALAADYVWSFSTAAVSPYITIWDISDVPTNVTGNDPNGIEVGVKFQSDLAGYINGIRFYKGPGNGGTHIGNLWDSTGQLLATAVFASETETGWQQVDFATPVAIAANTTYVASYYAPTGNYSYDSNYFTTSGVVNPPLRALANGADGGNGVYNYAAASTFPTQSFNASNYWVDVVFSTELVNDTEPPTVAITAPADGSTVLELVTITASATDNVGVAGVQFLLNGSPFGAEDIAWPYAVDWDTETVANGSYQLSAVARDGAGNTQTAASVTVTVTNEADITPPTVLSVVPAIGATGVLTSSNVVITFSEAMDPATIDGTTITLRDGGGSLVPATVSYNATSQAATLSPLAVLAYETSYTATVLGAPAPNVTDVAGNALAADYVWSFTTEDAPGINCPCTIWNDTVVPAIPEANDPSAIELGVKFQADQDGYIIGLRFYKGLGNTGTHVGNLWDSTGQLLASAIFVNETASGWQQLLFAAPVAVTANTTYVASYHAPNGNYAVDTTYFAAAGVVNPPLQALANGIDGGNGVFSYGPSAFPTDSFNAANYWVDVVFELDVAPPEVLVTSPAAGAVLTGTVTLVASVDQAVTAAGVQFQVDGINVGAEDTVAPYEYAWDTSSVANGAHQLTAVVRDLADNTFVSPIVNVTVSNDIVPPAVTVVSPTAGATDTALDANVMVTFDEAINPATINATTLVLRDDIGNLVPATVSYDAGTLTATLNPTNLFSYSSAYTATVTTGVTDLVGNAMSADFVWSFSTGTAPQLGCPCLIWSTPVTPTNPSFNDPNAIELGVRFQTDVAGYITGIRFYKGAGNTGLHVANLWDSSGLLLASAVFQSETATGWQQVNFAPVPVASNTTYVASYHAPNGNYAADSNFFSTAGVDNPPLRALSNAAAGGNGVFAYGPSSFPSNSSNASNYWVDVVFTTELLPDTEAPVVALTAPANGAVISGTVSIEAIATDNVAVAGVQFQVNGSNQGAEDNLAPYSISWDVSGLPNGVYQLSAIARDLTGNTATATAITVTVANDVTPPAVTAVTPVIGASNVLTTSNVTATFGEPLEPTSVTTGSFTLSDGATTVAAAVSYDGPSRTATLIPAAPLAYGTVYTATLPAGGVKDLAGNGIAADFSWSFTTVAAPGADCPCFIWPETTVPAVASVVDPNAIELGVKFQAVVDGYITGIRFYKGAGNNGTHVGNLWDSSGQLLGTAVFVNETATGWQQVLFATPVAVTANTTYVASYHAPNGNYAADSNYFTTSGYVNSPLLALSNPAGSGNGVYNYGPSAYPTSSFNATNYWVDVVFQTDVTPPATAFVSPTAGAVLTGTVTVEATATDANGIVGVQFQLDGVDLGTELTTAPYSLNWNTRTAANGVRALTVLARDQQGNVGSTTINVTLDNDFTPPSVLATSPISGAVDVPLGTPIVVTFDERLDPSSVNDGNVELRDGEGSLLASTVSYDDATRTVTITPAAALLNDETYSVLLQGGVFADRVGNVMASSYSWSFTIITDDVVRISTTANGSAGGVNFNDEDIVAMELATGAISIYLDGSDVGLTTNGADIDAFTILNDGTILMSFQGTPTLSGLGTVDDSDIIRFIPTSLGDNTSGTFTLYFDGSDVGLANNSEDIDALTILDDGRILISTRGSVSVPGVSGNDEDLLAFTPNTLGSFTSGSWAMYFDGSDVGLGGVGSEDINSVKVDADGNIYLSTIGNFAVTGLNGDAADIFVCEPISLGTNTSCTFRMYWDGSTSGFGGLVFDSINLSL